jgi:hypothetical protein
VLVTGELRLRKELSTEQIEELLGRIDRKVAEDVPEVAETFWELSRRSGGLLRPSAKGDGG